MYEASCRSKFTRLDRWLKAKKKMSKTVLYYEDIKEISEKIDSPFDNGLKTTLIRTFKEYEDDWGYHIPKDRYYFDDSGRIHHLINDEVHQEGWT